MLVSVENFSSKMPNTSRNTSLAGKTVSVRGLNVAYDESGYVTRLTNYDHQSNSGTARSVRAPSIQAYITSDNRSAYGGSTQDQQHFTDRELKHAAELRQKVADGTMNARLAEVYIDEMRSRYGYTGEGSTLSILYPDVYASFLQPGTANTTTVASAAPAQQPANAAQTTSVLTQVGSSSTSYEAAASAAQNAAETVNSSAYYGNTNTVGSVNGSAAYYGNANAAGSISEPYFGNSGAAGLATGSSTYSWKTGATIQDGNQVPATQSYSGSDASAGIGNPFPANSPFGAGMIDISGGVSGSPTAIDISGGAATIDVSGGAATIDVSGSAVGQNTEGLTPFGYAVSAGNDATLESIGSAEIPARNAAFSSSFPAQDIGAGFQTAFDPASTVMVSESERAGAETPISESLTNYQDALTGYDSFGPIAPAPVSMNGEAHEITVSHIGQDSFDAQLSSEAAAYAASRFETDHLQSMYQQQLEQQHQQKALREELTDMFAQNISDISWKRTENAVLSMFDDEENDREKSA